MVFRDLLWIRQDIVMKVGSLVKHTGTGNIHRVVKINRSIVRGYSDYDIYSLTPPLNSNPTSEYSGSVYKKYLKPWGFDNYLDKL